MYKKVSLNIVWWLDSFFLTRFALDCSNRTRNRP